jgi:hypothetical protein
MIDIFSSIPVRAQDITASLMNTHIQIHEKDLFTGVFHVNGKPQLVLLFAQGRIISMYKLTDGIWQRIPKADWDDVIAESSGDLRVASIATEGLRLLRLFLESDFSQSKTILSLPASELTSCVNNWQRGDRAGLVSVYQNGSGALMLFPPGEVNPAEAVMMDELQTQTGSAVVNQIRAWGSRNCQILLCTYHPNSEAWMEYSLRVSFAQFIQIILKRYGEMAGQFLVTNLNEQVNDEARSWDMALSLYGSKLSNNQFFENMERAGRAYVTIFSAMSAQMNEVVGEKLVVSIRKDAIMQLDLDNRTLVQEYVISRLDQG